MLLTTPDFTLPEPNKRSSNTTDAMWWLRCHLLMLEPTSEDGGTYANKPGFHNKGKQCKDLGAYKPGTDYSIRQDINRQGQWWREFSSAFDWTFKTAQAGNYDLIALYTRRLFDAVLDPTDSRVDGLYEFYGNSDWDSEVEGYNEWEERRVSSDKSHLWHIHFSMLRKYCGDFWQMWAIYTVLSGQSKAHWLSTLPGAGELPSPPPVQPPLGLPSVVLGSRVCRLLTPNMTGTDILYIQKFIGPQHCGTADGVFGRKTESGVKWYQDMRGIRADGIVGPQTWHHMGVK